jgi:hypothetical protein
MGVLNPNPVENIKLAPAERCEEHAVDRSGWAAIVRATTGRATSAGPG